MPRVLRKLQAGDRLRTGDKLESSNGLSTAALQDDGNFVVRRPCITVYCIVCASPFASVVRFRPTLHPILTQ